MYDNKDYIFGVQTLKYGSDGEDLIAVFPKKDAKKLIFAKLDATTGSYITV